MASISNGAFVIRVLSVGTTAITAMIVATLCIRVLMDGSAPIVTAITNQLSWLAIGSMVSMVAMITGDNIIVLKLGRPPRIASEDDPASTAS